MSGSLRSTLASEAQRAAEALQYLQPPCIEQQLQVLAQHGADRAPALERLAANAMSGLDDAAQQRVRERLAEFFGDARLARWTPHLAQALDTALARLAAATAPDLVTDFADVLHDTFMPSLLGLAPGPDLECLDALRRLGRAELSPVALQRIDAAVQPFGETGAAPVVAHDDEPEGLLGYLERHRQQLPAGLDTRYLALGLLAGSQAATDALAFALYRLLSGPREHWSATAGSAGTATGLPALLAAQAIPALVQRYPDLLLQREACRFAPSPLAQTPLALPCDLGGGSRRVSGRMCDIRERTLAREIVNDNRRFSPPRMEEHLRALARGSSRDLSTAIAVARNAMFFMDGERHLELRRAVADRLGGNRLGAWEAVVDAAIAEALDHLAAQPAPDLARDFAERLRAAVVSRILGVVPRDRERFEALAPGLQDVLAPWLSLRELERVQGVFREALDAMLEAPAGDPPGLLQALLASPPPGFGVDDLKAATLVLYGATFTLSHTLANILHVILERPPAERVGADSASWVEAHLEELIVLGTAPKYIYRMAREALSVGDLSLQPGDTVRLPLLAINRGRGTGHLSFGHGLHRCIGAALSRLLIRRAVPALFTRYPALALVAQGQRYYPMSQTVALRALPCRLGPNKETPR